MKRFLNAIFNNSTRPRSGEPTVVHITHYKAGSQWVYMVLNHIAEERIVTPEVAAEHYTRGGIVPGSIYPCVYLTKEQFKAVKRPRRSRVFIVIRDLRDTLISQYFSVKKSHEMLNPLMQRARDILNSRDLQEGLIHLMKNNLKSSAKIQRSWAGSWRTIFVKYEDLVADEYSTFNRIFDHCRFVSDETVRREAINAHSFERMTGRKPGEEDTNSHHRKGVSGDWENYFDKQLKDVFKEKYGQILIDTGYEKDFNW